MYILVQRIHFLELDIFTCIHASRFFSSFCREWSLHLTRDAASHYFHCNTHLSFHQYRSRICRHLSHWHGNAAEWSARSAFSWISCNYNSSSSELAITKRGSNISWQRCGLCILTSINWKQAHISHTLNRTSIIHLLFFCGPTGRWDLNMNLYKMTRWRHAKTYI
jgi:hypothetical protein